MENDIKLDYDNYDPNIFKRSLDKYEKALEPANDYIKQVATLVTKTCNISYDNAVKHVKDILKTKQITNPIVKFKHKQENGDTIEETLSLTNYIKDAVKNNEIIVPSFTTYYHPSVKESLHANFLNINVKLRKSDKQNSHKYKQLGDKVKALYYETMQKVRKVANNSLSGAYASKSTILNNPSAHYTLTSMTRCVASVGNAITESLVAGNKHFRSPDIMINYISSIITDIDMNKVERVVNRFNLYTPTAEEVLETMLVSSDLYWKDLEFENKLLDILKCLNKFELTAVCYVNDLFHMKRFNQNFVKRMIGELAEKKVIGSVNALREIEIAPEGVVILAHHILSVELKGKNIDYKELKESDPDLLYTIGSVVRNIMVVLERYKSLFEVFFVTNIMPIGIAYIKDIQREVIVLSDTDSTCGSYDHWVEWYFGEDKFTPEAIALSASVMTINTQIMDHYLKILSKNMNIENKNIELLKMKNEYFWTVFTAANVSKHYYADTLIKEGNVYKSPELELKGVHFIASSASQDLVARTLNMIKDINATASSGEKLSLTKYVNEVADMERVLIKAIKDGGVGIFKREKIKQASSYKLGPDKSPYLYHLLWEEVFSEKYGISGDPEYMAIKIPTNINSKKDMADYINNIQDKDIANKLSNFMTKYGKEAIKTFRAPSAVIGNSGIPDELLSAVDIKRIIFDNLNMAYLTLETIGFYRKGDMILTEMGY